MMIDEIELKEDEQSLRDLIVSATTCIRDGWTIKELIEELKYFCKEEEQIVALLSDSQKDKLNNNPDASCLVKKNKKGNIIEVVVAEPIPAEVTVH
jgi:hypothetical protein